MSVPAVKRLSVCGLAASLCLLSSCGRAPSFDILGSFFPAWLVCLIVGLLLTITARWIIARLQIVIALPVLTYPSLTALFTFAMWLGFFR
jgi:hypothetical protein